LQALQAQELVAGLYPAKDIEFMSLIEIAPQQYSGFAGNCPGGFGLEAKRQGVHVLIASHRSPRSSQGSTPWKHDNRLLITSHACALSTRNRQFDQREVFLARLVNLRKSYIASSADAGGGRHIVVGKHLQPLQQLN
jgi:hypothetical protein